MRYLDRLVSWTFLRLFLAFVIGAPVLFVVGDLADRIDTYLAREGLTGSDIALAYVYFLPKFVLWAFPFAALIAAVFTVHGMTTHREVVAAKAGGISFRRLFAPVILWAILLTAGGLALTEVVPHTNRKAATLLGEHEARQGWRNRFVYQNEDGVSVSVQRLNVADASLSQVAMQRERANGDGLDLHLVANSAQYDETDGWTFHDGFLRLFPDTVTERAYRFESYRTAWFTEQPRELLEDPADEDEMTYAQMGRLVSTILRSGGDPREMQVKKEMKLAIPVATLVVVLFGVPMATTAKRGGASAGIGIALATTILYLVLSRLASGFGESGALSPLVAAWAPNVLFLFVGLVLLARVRT